MMPETTDKAEAIAIINDALADAHDAIVEADVPYVEETPGPAAAPADGVIRDEHGNAIRHLRRSEIDRMNELARKA